MAIGTDWHIEAALGDLTIAVIQDTSKFVGERLFPTVNVDKQSDRYYTFTQGDWSRIPTQVKRDRLAREPQIEFGVSSNGYFADEYRLGEKIAKQDLANADIAFNLTGDSAAHITTILGLAQEDLIATLVTCGTNLGSYAALAASDRFSDFANSDPVGTISSGSTFMHDITGLDPNMMVVGYRVHNVLKRHPDVVDRVKYTARATDAEIAAALADVFGVDQYLVGHAVKNMAGENQANSMVPVWGNNIVLAYTDARIGPRVPSMGKTFQWNPAGFAPAFGVEWRDNDDISAREVRVGFFRDWKITGSVLGYAINSAI